MTDVVSAAELIPGQIEKTLINKSVKEISQIKANVLAAAVLNEYKRDGVLIEITSQPQVVDGNKLIVEIKATKDDVILPISNPLIFVNPPMKIAMDAEGKELKEDPRAVLEEILFQVVRRFL